MKELNSYEIDEVNGGWIVVVVAIAAAFGGGYMAGRQNKANRQAAEIKQINKEFCRDNPHNCA